MREIYYICVSRTKEYVGIRKPKKTKIEGATIGDLYIKDMKNNILFRCKTLENEGSSTDTPRLDKRIMPRSYRLEWTNTSVTLPAEYKGRGLLLTCDSVLPKFRDRRILIHIGNFPQDTEGCLLLGMKDNFNGTISQSTIAVKKFYDIIKENGVENFELSIDEKLLGSAL